jgi:hypothetical protein
MSNHIPKTKKNIMKIMTNQPECRGQEACFRIETRLWMGHAPTHPD